MKRFYQKIALLLFFLFCVTFVPVSVSQAAEYYLAPGDILNISVWGYPELVVQEQIIRPDGKIAFPLVGEEKAEGMTPSMLADILTEMLSDYVKDPKVTVNVFKPRTTRIYVLGEVTKPGMYEIERQHNLLDAIGTAGGYTKDAAKKNVFIMHQNSNEGDKPIQVNLQNLLQKADMSQNYMLRDGDVVYLSSNGRVDFARDILPWLSGLYYVRHLSD